MVVYILIISLFVLPAVIYAVKYLKKRKSGDNRRTLDLAMVGLSQQIRRNPNDAVAFAKRGTVRLKKGDIPGALEDLARALQIEPSSVEAHYHRGAALQAAGETSKAEKEYNWIMSHSEDPYYKTAVSNQLHAMHKGLRRV